MTEAMIDRLRELLRAATPGPWQLGRGEEGDTHFIAQNGWGGGGPNYYADAYYPQDEIDGELIVELRNHAAELLDAHDRMAGALREALDQWAMYANVERGPDPEYLDPREPSNTYLTWIESGTDLEAQKFAACRAALAVPKEENPGV